MTDDHERLGRIASEHLLESAESLVSAWIEWVRSRLPSSTYDALPERALRNHIPPVVRSLARYLETPVSASRDDLIGHLRLHGQIRRDQGYSLEEVLGEFDGLSLLISSHVSDFLIERGETGPAAVELMLRLSTGLRAIAFTTVGTYQVSHVSRQQALFSQLEDFARAIAHELRTPLSTVSMAARVLEEVPADEGSSDGGAAKRSEHLGIIRSAVGRAEQFLDNIRVLAVAAGAASGDELVSVVTAIEMVRSEFSLTGNESDAVGVRLDVDDDIPGVHVESLVIYLVLVNLIGNAIKYRDPAKEERWIRVSARVKSEELDTGFCEVEVSDNGLGVPEELLPRVFQRGFRAHPDQAPGTGLGLYLVRQILSERGGEVSMESEEGRGTAVRFRLRCLDLRGEAPPGRGLRSEDHVERGIEEFLRSRRSSEGGSEKDSSQDGDG